MAGTVHPPTDISSESQSLTRQKAALQIALLLLFLFLFFVGIRGMGTGFKGLGKELVESFFSATENPFVGLAVGILGTTLVQSSSVSTSMIVAMVAAPSSPLPLANAIPMIMGANIGTTVTNSIVALGHIGRPDEFKRAFSAATCHDFFNFMAVAVLLPLEMATGLLAKASSFVSTSLVGSALGGKYPNPLKDAAKACVKPLKAGLEQLTNDKRVAAAVLIVISVILIFVCLMLIVRALRKLTGSKVTTYVTRSLEAKPYVGMVVGVLVTIMVQSSSITTSILVPLAGAGLVSVRQIFPVTLGANVGTTVTALLASLAVSAETAHLGIQIATVHLLFNIIGILLVFPSPAIRAIPINAAERLANVAVRSKTTALLYVVGLFYGVPGALIALSRLF